MNVSAVGPESLVNFIKEGYRVFSDAVATSQGRWQVSDVLEQLYKGEQQLWVAYDDQIHGVVTTRIIEYPRLRSLAMELCAGDEIELWKAPMLEAIEQFASDCGCAKIEMVGRKGWERFLKADGFQKTHFIYEKDLTHGQI